MNIISAFLLFTLLLNQANMLNASCCKSEQTALPRLQELGLQIESIRFTLGLPNTTLTPSQRKELEALIDKLELKQCCEQMKPRCTLSYCQQACKVTCAILFFAMLLAHNADIERFKAVQYAKEKEAENKAFNALRKDLSESDATTLINFIHRTNDFTKPELFHQGNVAGFALCQQNANVLTSSLSMYDKGRFIGCRKSPREKAGPKQSRPRLSKFLYQMAPHPRKCFDKRRHNGARKK